MALAATNAAWAFPAQSAPEWREKYWFPVASTLELDPERPTPVRIDGLDLVVWRRPVSEEELAADPSDGWRIFYDMCPHRLAPLSEGRVEPKTGNLQCAYHGWEFDGSGANKRIPQVTEEEAARARASPRSSPVAYPVKKALQVLWVWLGETEPKGDPADLIAGTYLAEQEFYSSYTRDLPYAYDSLVENLADVSHIPFAHHGLQGTRDDAAPITQSISKVLLSSEQSTAVTTGGATADLMTFDFADRTMGMNRKASFFLKSPFFFYYLGQFEGKMAEAGATGFTAQAAKSGSDKEEGRPFRLNVICIPVSPGVSRLILLNAKKPGSDDFLSKLPRWVAHLFANRFLDSDLAFLHYQERNLRASPRGTGVQEWNSGYFMPAESDRSISAWRSWLAKEGARCVLPGPGSELPPSPQRRDQLMDRYTQHTEDCVHCRKALDSFDKAQKAAVVVGLVSLVLDRLSVGPTPLWLFLELLAVAVVFGVQQVEKLFKFVDYQHYKT